jgi:hypothetical protein
MENLIACRTLLKKDNSPDVRLEVHKLDGFSVAVVENGKGVGLFWRTVSPNRSFWGKEEPLSLQEALQTCAAQRHPDYTVTDLEEGFR